MKSLITFSIFALASLVHSAVVTRDTSGGVDVVLTQKANTRIQVATTNRGKEALNIFTLNNYFTKDLPVEKLTVSSQDKSIPFQGFNVVPALGNLTKDQFVLINPGQTINTEVDTGEVHDLKSGGTFDVKTEGTFLLADVGSTKLNGKLLPFGSNKLTIKVDGGQAASSFKNSLIQHSKRTTYSWCENQGHYAKLKNTTVRSLSISSSIAALGARYGSAEKFKYFFNTDEQSKRELVARNFETLVKALENPSGLPNLYCEAPSQYCSAPNVAVYTPYDGGVYFCPSFYDFPVTIDTCVSPDAGAWVSSRTEALFVTTAALRPVVNNPPLDYYANSPKESLSLPPEKATLNIFSYLLYYNAVQFDCNYPGPK